MAENSTKRAVEQAHLNKRDLAGRHLIVVVHPTKTGRDERPLLDVQLSSRDPKAKGQRGLHLTPHFIAYSPKVLASIRDVATGAHRFTYTNGLEVYAITGDLTSALHGPGFVVTNVGPSPERLDRRVLDRQHQSEDLARFVHNLTPHAARARIIGHDMPGNDSDDGGIEYGSRGHGHKPGEIVFDK